MEMPFRVFVPRFRVSDDERFNEYRERAEFDDVSKELICEGSKIARMAKSSR